MVLKFPKGWIISRILLRVSKANIGAVDITVKPFDRSPTAPPVSEVIDQYWAHTIVILVKKN